MAASRAWSWKIKGVGEVGLCRTTCELGYKSAYLACEALGSIPSTAECWHWTHACDPSSVEVWAEGSDVQDYLQTHLRLDRLHETLSKQGEGEVMDDFKS